MGYITKICPGLANHLTILRQIVVGNGAAGCRNCFAVTDTGNIIGVTDTGTTLGAAGWLALRHLKSSNLLCFPCFSFTARFSAIIRAIPRSSNFYALQLKDIAILKVNYKSGNCNRTKIGCEIISN